MISTKIGIFDLVLRKVRFQAEDSLFNILVLIRFPHEFCLEEKD
jgi:hypothetical protein